MSKLATLSIAALLLGGCTVNVQQPADEQPQIVQESAAVPAVEVDEYYYVGGQYYYWHPGLHRYVVVRDRQWVGRRVVPMQRLAPRPEIHRGPPPRPQDHHPDDHRHDDEHH